MTINIKISPTAETQGPLEHQESIKVSLNMRKTLDGKIMIFDHMHFDIIVDTTKNKIITFPKNIMDEEVYDTQNKYFKHLHNEGIIQPESVKSGNVYASIEAKYPDAVDENTSSAQIILLSTKKFIEEQQPYFEAAEFIENEIEDQYVDPDDEDSTELGEVPQAPKKGSIGPHRIRRYLSGYGYY